MPTISTQLLPIIDFGMLVLIWLVQLIVYPSFLHTAPEKFKDWHQRYTGLITYFVLPLMLSQLAIVAFNCYLRSMWTDWFQFALIVVAWGATFLLSVPCHNEMQSRGWHHATIVQLISTNWIRTVSWTGIFVLDLLNHYPWL